MAILLFLVCLAASALGAVAGFGGGVIIKPVVDALGILPVSTASFLSGCTVLGMSASSLLRGRHDGIKVQMKTSTPLAVGAALGGLGGKECFEWIRRSYGNESMLGLIQTALLLVTTIMVFFYVMMKHRLRTLRVENWLLCLLIGLFLGGISSFLGIGGGPINMAVLFFCFSMDVKTAAKNSIYIILFSQVFSLGWTMLAGTVPDFSCSSLLLMMAGGIAGAIVGAELSKRMDSRKVEKLLYGLMLVVIAINLYNFYIFTCTL